jgi:hypothetical protein
VTPTLPVILESVDAARARFPVAVVHVWDVQTVTEDMPIGDRPGKRREHVFDVEDDPEHALRLILSRDVGEFYDRPAELFHASASIIRGTAPSRAWRIQQVRRLLNQIVGRDLPAPASHHFSKGGVLHLFWAFHVLDIQEASK